MGKIHGRKFASHCLVLSINTILCDCFYDRSKIVKHAILSGEPNNIILPAIKHTIGNRLNMR